MHVLIVDDTLERQADLTMTLMRQGFETTPTGSQEVAETCIRRGLVDLVVMAERVEGKLTHSLALLAELKNPLVASILLTDRVGADVDELFLLLPSLHCILAPDTNAKIIGKLALASVSGAMHSDCPVVLPQSLRIDEQLPLPPFASVRPQVEPATPARARCVA